MAAASPTSDGGRAESAASAVPPPPPSRAERILPHPGEDGGTAGPPTLSSIAAPLLSSSDLRPRVLTRIWSVTLCTLWTMVVATLWTSAGNMRRMSGYADADTRSRRASDVATALTPPAMDRGAPPARPSPVGPLGPLPPSSSPSSSSLFSRSTLRTIASSMARRGVTTAPGPVSKLSTPSIPSPSEEATA